MIWYNICLRTCGLAKDVRMAKDDVSSKFTQIACNRCEHQWGGEQQICPRQKVFAVVRIVSLTHLDVCQCRIKFSNKKWTCAGHLCFSALATSVIHIIHDGIRRTGTEVQSIYRSTGSMVDMYGIWYEIQIVMKQNTTVYVKIARHTNVVPRTRSCDRMLLALSAKWVWGAQVKYSEVISQWSEKKWRQY